VINELRSHKFRIYHQNFFPVYFSKLQFKQDEEKRRPRPNKKVRNKIGGVLDECFTHYQKTKIQGGAGVTVIFSLSYFYFFYYHYFYFLFFYACLKLQISLSDRLKLKRLESVEFYLSME